MAVAAIEIRRMNLADLNPSFGHWIAGFADGEACFNVHVSPRDHFRIEPEFSIRLRADDRDILEELALVFPGSVLTDRGVIVNSSGIRSNPTTTLRVSGWRKCLFVVDFFETFSLRAKKKRDFEKWAEIVRALQVLRRGNKHHGPANKLHILRLVHELREGRRYVG